MHNKVSEPTLTKVLKQAVDQDQVVPVPAPSPSPSRRPPPTPPPLRDRDEASLAAVFCLMFKLRRNEGRMLARLTTRDYCSRKELLEAINHDIATVAFTTITALVCKLRQSLAPHSIEIATVTGLGYGLRPESRAKIRKALAKYDAGLIPTAEPPRPDRRGITDNAHEAASKRRRSPSASRESTAQELA